VRGDGGTGVLLGGGSAGFWTGEAEEHGVGLERKENLTCVGGVDVSVQKEMTELQ
jgi:hypothetical protein